MGHSFLRITLAQGGEEGKVEEKDISDPEITDANRLESPFPGLSPFLINSVPFGRFRAHD